MNGSPSYCGRWTDPGGQCRLCPSKQKEGCHEIPVAGSGRPGLDDEQVQAPEENHRHHPYHPVLRILLRCRAVHHLVDVCRRGLGVGLKQSLFFVGVGLVPTLIGRCKQPSWAGTSPAPTADPIPSPNSQNLGRAREGRHCRAQPKQFGVFQKRDCRAPCGGLQ